MNTIPENPASAHHRVRERLLEAAADLLSRSDGEPVSTRAVCAAVGVKPPTLYHYFGSKEGLLDAVASYGFEQYVGIKHSQSSTGDPVELIRRGWDVHVQFGCENPNLYALMYGRVRPHIVTPAAQEAEQSLLDLCSAIAREGRLLVLPAEACARILATNVGVTLSLITHPRISRSATFSSAVRDAVIASIVRGSDSGGEHHPAPAATPLPVESLSIALHEALQSDPTTAGPLQAAEKALLLQWLTELSGTRAPDAFVGRDLEATQCAADHPTTESRK